MAVNCESAKLMKSRFLLLVLMSSLGSATGLAQFSLSAALTKTDADSYVLNLSASGSRDVVALGATFTMEIWRNIEQHDPTPVIDEPFFSPQGATSPALLGTPFYDEVTLGAGFYGVYHIAGYEDVVPDLYSGVVVSLVAPYGSPGVSLPFKSGPQALLKAGIAIPSGLQPGTWRLVLPNTGNNHLVLSGESQPVPFDNVQLDYILRYDGVDLTLEVPEPSQFAVVGGLALLGFAGWRRSRR